MNHHKILKAAFKEEIGDGWESEFRDFEHGGSGWYEAVLIALEKVKQGDALGSWQCCSCGRVYSMSVTECPNCKPIGQIASATGHHKTDF